jgi:hypothetical protein
MSSAATSSEKQSEANRQNARHSTGPRTAEGKAASSRNATRYGLFAVHLQVREDEADDYEMLRNEFLDKYRPEGVLEDCLALEMINAQWRLLRCTRAEAAIPALQNEANPVHDFANPAQTAINRARAAAELSLRRNMKTYKEMQTERFQRAEMLTEGPIHPDSLGMVPLKSAIAPITSEMDRARLGYRADNLQRAAAARLQNEAIRDFEASGGSGNIVELYPSTNQKPHEQPTESL